MANVISLSKKDGISSMWHDAAQLKEIRQMVSSTPLTEIEFQALVGIGRATGLNPFLRELWAVKYGSKAAQIFIGRDGYRLGAQRHHEYEYHQVESVYSNDKFEIINGEINHRAGFSNRGDLLGAYCIVKRKSASKATHVIITMKEYDLDQSLWKSKPETMIKKVAEAQGLRQSFQDVFGGTYSDAEMPQAIASTKPLSVIAGKTQTEKLKNILKQKENLNTETGEIIEHGNVETNMEKITRFVGETNLPMERIEKALSHYEINSLDEMNESQQESFLNYLERIKDKMRN
jgi:phage recombination protein Bet